MAEKSLDPPYFGFFAAVTALAAILTGCTVGPDMLRVSRMAYNDAIQQTADQQLLLNLVRLKYRDAPLFLEVGSISAQFQFDRSGAVSGQLNENVGINPLNPNTLRIDGRIGYIEKPTITMTPLQGDEFVTRLLTPLSMDTIVLLMRTGWSIDRVLRLSIQRINGLDNAAQASGPTPDTAPSFRRFAEASSLMRVLQKAGTLQVGYESRDTELSPTLPVTTVRPGDLISAAREGYSFKSANLDQIVLTKASRSLVLRIAPEAMDTPEGRRLAQLLDLSSDQDAFDLVPGTTRQSDAAAHQRSRTIAIAARSLMGSLFYLANAVEVPPAHRNAGLVTTTVDELGNRFDWAEVTGELLRIRSQRTRPTGAAVAVRYRGYWFYIDDADLNSKSTFSLLTQLFSLQAGGAEGVTPVLTLPIG